MLASSSPAATGRILARVGTVVQQKYRIGRLLGIGGTAAVYAATHRNGHQVAIKFLLEHLLHDSDMYGLFRREAYVANRVGHPGAVPVLDDDVDEGGDAFLIMPLLEGETLRARWERSGKKLPLADVAVLAFDLLDVLASAHAKGIVHRDIKPENLFVTRAGELRVLDFGIARRSDVGATLTLTGRVIGTPAFMPPEQALSDKSKIGPASDLWAVGATLFSLLSGQLVHEAESAGAQLVATATKPARSLGSVAPDLPQDIVAWVDRALAFEPEQRWGSAMEMREALRAALESEGEDIEVATVRVRAQMVEGMPSLADLHQQETQVPKLSRDIASGVRVADCRIFHETGAFATGLFERIYFSLLLQRDMPPGVHPHVGLDEAIRLESDGIALVCMLGPSAQGTDEDLRMVAESFEKHGASLRCAAIVCEGDDQKREAFRQFLLGMTFVLSRRTPMELFPSLETALPWIAKYVPVSSMDKAFAALEGVARRLRPPQP